MSDSVQSQTATEYRQTFGDDSPRGGKYLDDRTKLAYVYDGCCLQAILFKAEEVTRYREETLFDVTLTPAGEARIGGEPA